MTNEPLRRPFQPTWASLASYTVPGWYSNGKFGIFIHWGVYAVTAFGNEWYPRNMYVQGSKEFAHHLATYGPHTKHGYKDFISQFTAERFDASAWADLFAQAGARFVVPVAEHHDGFAMYRSRLSQWTAVTMGPKRDIIGELASATRARGMVFGVSTHRAEHWWFFNGGREFPSDVQDPAFDSFYGPAQPRDRQPSAAYLDDWYARTCELVENYRPQLVWFDWWIEQPVFEPYLRRFAAHYYNLGAQWQMGVAINYKHQAFRDGSAVYDVERGQLSDIRPAFWQTDTAVAKTSWGYVANQQYKTATDLIHDLVDIVSKNGALLLNIGPRPDGTIPEPEQQLLREIGAWLAINGEAVYGTEPWSVYGEGPTAVVGGSFNDTKRPPFTGRDMRFTTRGDALYAIMLGIPEGEVVMQSLGTNHHLYPYVIDRVELVGHHAPVTWTRAADGLYVTLPAGYRASHALVLKIGHV